MSGEGTASAAQPSLVAFLAARLDEDEAVARAAGGDTWQGNEGGIYHEDARTQPGPFAVGPYDYLLDEERAHIARHDPARLLREVAAKRAILELHDGSHECSGYNALHGGEFDNCMWISDGDTCSTLHYLAAVYSDHPDYRDEWMP